MAEVLVSARGRWWDMMLLLDQLGGIWEIATGAAPTSEIKVSGQVKEQIQACLDGTRMSADFSSFAQQARVTAGLPESPGAAP
jgi:hypothetical protein